MSKIIKRLKTIRTNCGDYIDVMERFAVIKNGERVGTVLKFTGHSGPTFYDPLRGTVGRRGDGHTIPAANGHIKRFYTFDEAVAAI